MSYLRKKQVIKSLCSKEIWDIDESIANEAVKNVDSTIFKKYDYRHYKIVYLIICEKLKHFNDIEKTAYLNCLIMNYRGMQSTKALTILKFILSGSFLGISIVDLVADGSTIIAFLAIGLLFSMFALELLSYLSPKWEFYLTILNQVKTENNK